MDSRLRKRRRPALACAPCRLRKVKCDREDPCSQCLKTSTVNTCYYDSQVRQSPSNGKTHETLAPQSQEQTAGYVSLPDGSRRLVPASNRLLSSSNWAAMDLTNPLSGILPGESVGDWPDREEVTATGFGPEYDAVDELNGHSVTSQGATLSTDTFASARELTQLRTTVHLLGQRLYRLEQKSSHQDSTTLQNDEHALRGNLPAERIGPTDSTNTIPNDGENFHVTLAQPRLRLAPDKIKYWGPSHYVHSFDKADLYSELKGKKAENFSHELQRSGILPLIDEVRGLRRQIKARQHVVSSPLLSLQHSLPPKTLCDELYRNYLRTFEVLYPIVLEPDFVAQYNAYWVQPRNPKNQTFMMKLCLVLAIGSVFHNGLAGEDEGLKQKASQWVYTSHWLLDGPSEKAKMTLEGLQIRSLTVVCRQVLSIGSVEAIWMAAGVLLRHAMSLGLHHNPYYMPEFSCAEADTRRRIWRIVLEILVTTALDAGQSPMLNLRTIYDGRLEGRANKQDVECANKGVARSSIECRSDVLLDTLQHSLLDRFHVADLLAKPTQTLQWVDVGKRVSSFIDGQTIVQVNINNYQPPEGKSYHLPTRFHLAVLCAYLAKFTLLITRPFITHKETATQSTDQRHAESHYVESVKVLLHQVRDVEWSDPYDNDLWCLNTSASGCFKGGLSFDATVGICHHLHSYMREETKGDIPLTLDAKVRIRLELEKWTWLQERLKNLIARGEPSMKRYIFLTAKLAQFDATLHGESGQKGLIKGTRHAVETCKRLLSEHLQTTTSDVVDGTGNGGLTANLTYDNRFDGDHGLSDPPLFDMSFDMNTSWLQGLFAYTPELE